MSEQRVLAAAAVLREFNLDEIAASCDEQPPAIVELLDSLPSAVQRVRSDSAADVAPRWRVVDRAELRRRLRAVAVPVAPLAPIRPGAGAERLRHAEEMLVKCGAEPSESRRQMLVGTAVNHLRRAVAADLPGQPWWRVELGDQLLDRLPDPATAARLRLDVTVARLALGDAAVHPVSTSDVLDRVAQFRAAADLLCGEERLRELVRGFVDLVTARLIPELRVVERLVVAIARRRARARVGSDLDGALQALTPLVKAAESRRGQDCDLYRTLRHLPDGRDEALVYTDLLSLLPSQLDWQPRREWLPGALVEVTAEPAVVEQLSRHAQWLEADLRNSPFQSDKALIGQAAHVIHALAFDDAIGPRGDRTRVELIMLARAHLWPAPAPDQGRVP